MENSFDVVVIGGGPGGYSAAIRLAQGGLDVACVEREEVGGVCLNWGCVPSKAVITTAERYQFALSGDELGIASSNVQLDMKRVAERSANIVEHHTSNVKSLLSHNGARLIQGNARLDGPKRVIVTQNGKDVVLHATRAIVLATGASPRELTGFQPDETLIRTARSAVFLQHVPSHLIVLGGRVIGIELGSAYERLGAQLTIVEMGDQLLAGIDSDLVRVVRRNLEARGVRILTGTRAQGWKPTPQGVEISVQGPKGPQTISGSEALVAVGFAPHTRELGLEKAGVELTASGHVRIDRRGRTSAPGVFAIGDLTGPPYLAHKAYAEASVVSGAILGEAAETDFYAMPAVVFSDPEIATVGLSEERARALGKQVTTGRFPFAASSRAQARGQGHGFVKLVAENGYLVGAGIVGPEASELIAQLALALETRTTLEDLALTIFPHPTLSEAVHDAAEHALGRAVHVINRTSKTSRRTKPLNSRARNLMGTHESLQ